MANDHLRVAVDTTTGTISLTTTDGVSVTMPTGSWNPATAVTPTTTHLRPRTSS
jgi:hypothetical protein